MKRKWRRYRRWLRTHPLLVVSVLLALNVVAMAALVIALLPRDEPAISTSEAYRDLAEHRAVRADVRGEPRPPSVLGSATVPPPPQLYTSPLARLRIPSIGVDAPVQVKNIDAQGVMESPDGPKNVAWYNFTAKPGMGGNAVLSGHVDYINYGAAVFYNLRKLQDGDTIEALLEDGTVIQYSVTGIQLYPLESIPMDEVLNPTPSEAITLITCGGPFSNGAYTSRLVVRATRTTVVAPAS
jgi:LPXTG-site transpeptidase (sortase) family protein